MSAQPVITAGERRPDVVTVTESGYRLAFAYDPAMVEEVKHIPGRRFEKDTKTWMVPRTADAVTRLRAFLARYTSVQAGDEVHADMEAVLTRADVLAAASKSTDAEIRIEGLAGELRPFQRAGVAYALEARRTFIADEMGLGKTLQALATCQAADAFPALVVCPASLRLNWQREAQKWLPGRSTAVLSGKRPVAVPRADIVIINYDILDAWQEMLVRAPFQAVVFDESHYLKSGKALRTKAAKAIAKDRPIVLCLSGTPMLNRPAEMITQLQILDRLGDLGGWGRYAKRYCNGFKGRFGWDLSGAAHLDELNEALRRLCYVRRLKRDVLTELPAKVRVEVPVEIDNRDEYARAATDVKRWLQGQVDSDQEFLESIAHLSAEAQARARGERRAEVDAKARKAEELVRINALKRLAATGKLAAAKAWITDFLESGEKLIVFAHHTEVGKALAREFKAPLIIGETAMDARQAAVDRFQSDPACRVIVLNLAAGGVGLTLTAASNVAFIELGWTPGGHDQAEDRAHRIGQTDSVTAWYLLGEDTIDQDIYALIEAKRAVVEAATDGGITIDEGSMLNELLTRIAA